MDIRHRNPGGAPVVQCADEDTCTVFSCEVCLVEIPPDAVKLMDAQDYVHHFCGLDCLEIWQRQAAHPQPARPARRFDRLK
ncbi:DUF3330 domain-containing protein [Thiobacillus sedimenti]|uniref:DUF3330 domain-containing protein n=1 Tax=Thiobacillus sedimenti TaxID=3110231 RepID=A0ABZ1CKM8_9PROT|nr:DUF3330 domain-containing protein [Thiobacillus sp. SCUT-2]WRS39945.1 DUF3330 domain-containing protein [Thiobacillus sp. SCUT-2]